jgi:hypothetical protein
LIEPSDCRAHFLTENYFDSAPQSFGQARVLDCWPLPYCDFDSLDVQQPLSETSPVDGKHRPLPEPAQHRD